MVTQSAAPTMEMSYVAGLGVRTASQLQHEVLPVSPVLHELLPQGLRRGATVRVSSTSLMLLLLALPTQSGSWAAVVGFPDVGMVAAAELGVALQRCALVPLVDRHGGQRLPKVIATLLDAVDLVVVHQAQEIPAVDARRLIARARERRTVLILSKTEWQGITPLTLAVVSSTWRGVGHGDGHLNGRWVEVTVTGRAAMSRPINTSIWLGSGPGSEPRGENPYKTFPIHESGRSHVS